jgi:CheY-like chemotaxis protein
MAVKPVPGMATFRCQALRPYQWGHRVLLGCVWGVEAGRCGRTLPPSPVWWSWWQLLLAVLFTFVRKVTGHRPPVSALRILVVEDADDLREITELILKKAGYQVITANSGAQALETLAHLDGDVDLLLTDVVMPRMQGPDLAGRIKAVHPETRVIYMSGYAQTILGDGGTLAAGVLLVEKPFIEAALLAKVEQAFHGGVLVAS